MNNAATTPPPPPPTGLSAILPPLTDITERAAIAAAAWRGKGNQNGADQAAVDAMRAAFSTYPIDGIVVIGEGERDKAPMLYTGEAVGCGGVAVDIAIDPLECTDLTARNIGGALSVIALAPRGGLLVAPDVYMEKIAISDRYPAELADLDISVIDRIHAIAEIKNCDTSSVGVCMLDRPRHTETIRIIRETGATLKLIPDGDVAAVIEITDPRYGIDFYLGIGGAPEGVLAAAVLRCLGGAMQGRLIFPKTTPRHRQMKNTEASDKLNLDDMVRGDVIFAATGVTHGLILDGITTTPRGLETHSLMMESTQRRVQRIRTLHGHGTAT